MKQVEMRRENGKNLGGFSGVYEVCVNQCVNQKLS